MGVPEPGLAPESEFRLLVEQVEDYAISLLDPAGRVVTWNAGAERLKGYTAEEIRGEHFSTFYPEEARERRVPERQLAVAADEGRVEDYGWRVRKDGSRFWAHVVVTSLWEDGELRGYGEVIHDLDEHRRVDEILDRISDAVVAFDERLRFTYVNDRATKLFARQEEELVGSALTELVPAVESTRIHRELRRALETQQPRTFEHHSELLDRWVDVRIYPSDSGLSVSVQSVSEQREQHERLREEKALVEQILEVSPMAMAVFDATGTVVQSNARAEALLGEEGRPLLGRSLEGTEGTLYDEQGDPLSLEDYPTRTVLEEGEPVLGYKHGV
ncbi:PAS domain S-box-containing protein [Halogranum amylolyticum]|uniref:PAS domain S-box-containing protein n=1 Tax=Halogranum amylolyticum TaxID=660520 RepID=A0A1H8SG56_9EURY|nr:PAS domain S-box protein [Halogranum amylolyticum]SEO77496.1 PAS domain S-box-containing protein [Halogranum amylolyticum]